jgi:hypothetical protein
MNTQPPTPATATPAKRSTTPTTQQQQFIANINHAQTDHAATPTPLPPHLQQLFPPLDPTAAIQDALENGQNDEDTRERLQAIIRQHNKVIAAFNRMNEQYQNEATTPTPPPPTASPTTQAQTQPAETTTQQETIHSWNNSSHTRSNTINKILQTLESNGMPKAHAKALRSYVQ